MRLDGRRILLRAVAAIAVAFLPGECALLRVAPLHAAAASGVCEVVNSARQPISFTVTRSGVKPRSYILAAGDRTQISVADAAVMQVPSGQRVALAADMRYEFRGDGKGSIALDRIERRTARPSQTPKPAAAANPLAPASPIISSNDAVLAAIDSQSPGGSSSKAAGGNAGAPAAPAEPRRTMAKVTVVTVKLLVDDEEAARTELWHKRLADRLAAASKIIAATANIRFQVTDDGTRDSDDKNADFGRSLAEFEKEADPAPARVAIGFSSQFKIEPGAVHLGGTRGPLHSHILLREWSKQTSENERLEVLVHELGHYLGAVHSRENDSVMRSKLGDRISRVKGFEIKYDDANARIMRLLSEEMRSRPVHSLRDLSARTKAEMLGRYTELLKIQPDDPATRRHIELIRQAGGGQ
jgi:hypothetical protein